MTEFALVPLALLTSTIAATLGMGGGVILIAVMPGFVPPAAIIPIHAVTQLASNLSRAAFTAALTLAGAVPPSLVRPATARSMPRK